VAGVRRDSKVEKWERDLEAIKNEVLGLHHNRDVYRTVGRIVDEHGGLPPSLFFDYTQRTYAVTQCAAIRRQAEVHPARVVSLASLLAEMDAEPERLTRERFIAQYDDPDPYFEQLGQATFDERFAGEAGDHIDPRIVEADLNELRAASEKVERYVDRYIAHTDREGLETLPTFGEIDEAIDTIGRLFKKYALLLTASGWATLEPVPQHDWLAIFRQAWIKPDEG
jgi:HEPN superfamily AbiU2-like protein